MNAVKYTLTVEAQVLDIAVLRTLLHEVLDGLDEQKLCGNTAYIDGDYIEWNVNMEAVEI